MDVRSLTAILILFAGVVTGLELENIIRGETVKYARDYPHQVSIQAYESHICGGSLIAPDTVLTANHCFRDEIHNEFNPLPYEVLAGNTNLNNVRNPPIKVTTIYLHNDYVKDLGPHFLLNDIAILKLEYSFPVLAGSSIDVISLPEYYETFNDRDAIATGFGWDNIYPNPYRKSENDDKYIGSSTKILHSLDVKILSENECYDSDTFYCVKPLNMDHLKKGICRGDSGGPLNVDKKVVGIASWNDRTCDDRIFPARYTKVTPYLGWIRDVIEDKYNSNIRRIDM